MNDFLESLRGGVVSAYAQGEPQLSFALVESGGQPVHELAGERVFYSASTVKVGVLVAVLRQVEEGRLSLTQPLTVTHTFRSVAPGGGEFEMEEEETDPGMGQVGSTCTLAHALERMITVSANCATNMLFELVGAESIQRAFADAGASECAMRRPFSDAAGLAAGITNSASASGLARFMLALGQGRLLPQHLTDYALELCSRVEEPVLAPAIISALGAAGGAAESGVLVASKAGSVSGIEHDCAYVRWRGREFALAVCTSGMTEGAAHEAMRATAEALLARHFGERVGVVGVGSEHG